MWYYWCDIVMYAIPYHAGGVVCDASVWSGEMRTSYAQKLLGTDG